VLDFEAGVWPNECFNFEEVGMTCWMQAPEGLAYLERKAGTVSTELLRMLSLTVAGTPKEHGKSSNWRLKKLAPIICVCRNIVERD
jgi:hypothetical protein